MQTQRPYLFPVLIDNRNFSSCDLDSMFKSILHFTDEKNKKKQNPLWSSIQFTSLLDTECYSYKFAEENQVPVLHSCQDLLSLRVSTHDTSCRETMKGTNDSSEDWQLDVCLLEVRELALCADQNTFLPCRVQSWNSQLWSWCLTKPCTVSSNSLIRDLFNFHSEIQLSVDTMGLITLL